MTANRAGDAERETRHRPNRAIIRVIHGATQTMEYSSCFEFECAILRPRSQWVGSLNPSNARRRERHIDRRTELNARASKRMSFRCGMVLREHSVGSSQSGPQQSAERLVLRGWFHY